MSKNFDTCFPRLMAHEGGYVNHPSDPGGPTKYGVTLAEVRRLIKPSATAADVKALTMAEANAVYKADYWDKMRCDDLPAGVDDCVFDYGVNSGVGRAPAVLARLVGVSAKKITPEVIAAAAKRDPVQLINAICDERLTFMRGIIARKPKMQTFWSGWQRRVSEVRAFAISLAKRASLPEVVAPSIVPTPLPATTASGKAMVPDNAGARTASTASTAVTGATAAQQAGAHGAHWSVIILILAVTVAIAVAIHFYLEWRRDRAHMAIDPSIRPVPPVIQGEAVAGALAIS